MVCVAAFLKAENLLVVLASNPNLFQSLSEDVVRKGES